MSKRDKIAELGRQEHEDRESVRRLRKKQRKHKKATPIPRSIRAHRYAEKPDDGAVVSDLNQDIEKA